MGENITTRGIDLLGLPAGTVLQVGDTAAIEITGLRNPCAQLNKFQPHLMQAVLDRDAQGKYPRENYLPDSGRLSGDIPSTMLAISRP